MGTLRFVYDNKNNEVSLLSKHYSKDFQNHGLQAIAASVVIFYAEKPDANNSLPWAQEHQRDIPASLSMIPAPVMMGMPGPHEQGLYLGPRMAPQDGCSVGFQGGYSNNEGVAGQHPGLGPYHRGKRAGRRRVSVQESITASPSSSVEVVDADASMPESSIPTPGLPQTHLINGTGGAGPTENYSHPGLHTEGDDPRARVANLEYSRGVEYSRGADSLPPGHPEPCIRTDGFVMQLQPSMAANSGACEGDARTSGSQGHHDGFSVTVNSGMEQGEAAQGSVESSSVSLVGSHGAVSRQGPEVLHGHASLGADRSASSVAAPVHVEENGSRHNDLGEGGLTQPCSDASATGCAAPPSSTMTTASSGGEPQMYAMPVPTGDRSLDINSATSGSRMEVDRNPGAVFPLREAIGPGASNSFGAQDPGRNVHLDNVMQIDLTEIKVEPVDHDMLVDAHMMPPGPSSSRRRTFHGFGFPPEAMLGARNSTGSLEVELLAAHPAGAGVFRMPGPMGRSLPSGQSPLQRKPSAKAGKDSPKQMARSRRSAQCALCSAGIFSLMDYLKHLHIHRDLLENSTSYSCPVCLKSSQSYSEVAKVHVAMHIDKDSHTCPICGVHITRKDALKRHFLLLHPSHMSEFANYSLQLAGLMSEAWKKLAPKAQPSAPATPSRQMLNQSTTCSFCQLTVDSKDDFMTHVEMHACLSPEFRCPICLQVFSTRCHLTRHAACHLTKEWACPLCFQTFARSDSYNRHMRNMHRKPDPDPDPDHAPAPEQAPAASTEAVPS